MNRAGTMDQTLAEGIAFLREERFKGNKARVSVVPQRFSPDNFDNEENDTPMTVNKRSKSRSPSPTPRKTKKSSKTSSSSSSSSPKKSPKTKASSPKAKTSPKAAVKATKKVHSGPKPAVVTPKTAVIPTTSTHTIPSSSSSSVFKTSFPTLSTSPVATAPVYTSILDSRNFDDHLNEFASRAPQSTGPDSGLTEIVLSFDVTSSMSSAFEQMRNYIRELTDRLFSQSFNIKIGLIAHGDYCDVSRGAVLQYNDLSNNQLQILEWIRSVKYGSGGDSQENYEMALETAARKMSWTPGSHRVMVMIGDSFPHPPKECEDQMKRFGIESPRAIDWEVEADECWKNGIKVYAVHYFPATRYVKPYNFFRSVAARTCGTYCVFSEFSVVTDMLLMVCYREGRNRAGLEEFRQEIVSEGRMCPERSRIFATVAC